MRLIKTTIKKELFEGSDIVTKSMQKDPKLKSALTDDDKKSD